MGIEGLAAGLDDLTRNREALALMIYASASCPRRCLSRGFPQHTI